ncbi:MAG: hypothetical protein KIS81_02610 [Maricaulaceae bacterium]|nr:hypothetical protein [Maricaulaceae bacterium]
MTRMREKFATQMDAALLADLRELAKAEGRQIQALVDEAVAGLIEQRRQSRARPHVMTAYQASHARFAPLYEKLAR